MIKKVILLLTFIASCWHAQAQRHITFRHLNTSNGLSYIGVSSMCTDRRGNLWIGTGNGLNMFNGKTVDKYFATEYPQLQNSNIIHVACDSNNRIWVLTANGNLTIVDEKRKFHRVGIYEKDVYIKTRWILESQKGNLMLFTSNGQYVLNPGADLAALDSLSISQFSRLDIQGFDTLQKKFYKQVFYYDDDHYLFFRDDVFYKVNYRTKMLEQKFDLPNILALTKLDKEQLLAYDRITKEVKIIDLATGSITFPFKGLKDQYGQPITAQFNFAEKLNDHQYILTTQKAGIYIYDHNRHEIYNHTHHFADPTSIMTNVTSNLKGLLQGWR